MRELINDPFYELIEKYDRCIIDYCLIEDHTPHQGYRSHKDAVLFAMLKVIERYIDEQLESEMAAFVAQNIGAGKYQRARKALAYAIGVSTMLAVVMFAVTFWRGDLLAGVFSNDLEVIRAGADYLKAYAIDCLQTCFLFCFIGFFNGIGMTRFVMIQGVIGRSWCESQLPF